MKVPILVVGGIIVGTVGYTAIIIFWLFSTFVEASDFADLKWSVYKQQINEIEDDIEDNPGTEKYEDRLEETLDRFCKDYPEDRDCED